MWGISRDITDELIESQNELKLIAQQLSEMRERDSAALDRRLTAITAEINDLRSEIGDIRGMCEFNFRAIARRLDKIENFAGEVAGDSGLREINSRLRSIESAQRTGSDEIKRCTQTFEEVIPALKTEIMDAEIDLCGKLDAVSTCMNSALESFSEKSERTCAEIRGSVENAERSVSGAVNVGNISVTEMLRSIQEQIEKCEKAVNGEVRLNARDQKQLDASINELRRSIAMLEEKTKSSGISRLLDRMKRR